MSAGTGHPSWVGLGFGHTVLPLPEPVRISEYAYSFMAGDQGNKSGEGVKAGLLGYELHLSHLTILTPSKLFNILCHCFPHK